MSIEDGEEVLAHVRRMQRRFGETISVFLTRRCPLKCAHCLVDAGDHGEDLPPVLVEKLARDIASLKGIKWLGLTGGEPMLRLETVRLLSAAAAASGIQVSVSTSAYWAASPRAARQLIDCLPNVDRFAISTDSFHLPFVPFDRIRWAYEAVREAKRSAVIRVTAPGGFDVDAPWFHELAELAGPDLQTGELLSVGRGRDLLLPEDISCHIPPIPCLSLGPAICEDGLALPCCNALLGAPRGHVLELGNLHDCTLQEIVQTAATHPILHLLRTWGFPWLFEKLEQEGLGKFLPTKHIVANPCATCQQLFSRAPVNAFLTKLADDPDFVWSVAQEAFRLLEESAMVESLAVGNEAEL